MQPAKKVKWIEGLKKAYLSVGATQRDQYSWVAKSKEHYVFSVEIDHINPEDNVYNHTSGVFFKRVPPMTIELGRDPLSVSHSKELFNAAEDAYKNKLNCQILLVKGTKFGKTKGPVKAAVEGHFWQVTELIGDVPNGYELKIERVA